MKTELWVIGKTAEPYLEEGIALYCRKLTHYLDFQIRIFSLRKSKGKVLPQRQKDLEAALILEALQAGDFLVLLDENGRELTSRDFASFLEKKMTERAKRLIFLVGGAYGFSSALREKGSYHLSLSKMTFSHQMVRLFFVEQLYRACSIIRNEPYHND